jgi:hypothetical protein
MGLENQANRGLMMMTRTPLRELLLVLLLWLVLMLLSVVKDLLGIFCYAHYVDSY